MTRKKSELPKAKAKSNTMQIPFRLTADDLATIDRIARHYHLQSRAAAVRLAVHHVAGSMGPITATPPQKNS